MGYCCASLYLVQFNALNREPRTGCLRYRRFCSRGHVGSRHQIASLHLPHFCASLLYPNTYGRKPIRVSKPTEAHAFTIYATSIEQIDFQSLSNILSSLAFLCANLCRSVVVTATNGQDKRFASKTQPPITRLFVAMAEMLQEIWPGRHAGPIGDRGADKLTFINRVEATYRLTIHQ